MLLFFVKVFSVAAQKIQVIFMIRFPSYFLKGEGGGGFFVFGGGES